MALRKSAAARALYEQKVDTITAAGAISHTAMTTGLTVVATKAYTLSAPTFAGQRKIIYTDSAASSPIATVAVASCKGAGATPATRTFAGFGTISGSAPKTLELWSPTGAYWIPLSMVGVTVS